MGNVFENIPPRGKLLIAVLLICIIGLSLSFLANGLIPTLIITGVIIIILIFTKPVWLPEDYGKYMIRKFSLVLILLLTGSYPIWNTRWSDILNKILEKYFPNYETSSSLPAVISLTFAFLAIVVVNYFNRDRTVMQQHPSPIEREFPEKEFKEQLLQFSRVLENELNTIDIESNWSDFLFTPLEAEVEIIKNNKRQRKVTDLIKAIKQDKKSRTFLVIGDPGSGKSTSLRKLAKELLKEVKSTGKVPIYINLKEWQGDKKITKENPPSTKSLFDFIIKNLKNRGDIFSNSFIDAYLTKMVENGRVFFILDSFDEIPEILDANESSWVIDELSDTIYRFLNGAHESKGILASRIFRRPTRKFKSKTVLEIRPFSETKIQEALQKALLKIDKSFIKNLFTSRPDLISIARNPFSAALIISYLKENSFRLPDNQADLYFSYIQNRLKSCDEKIKGYDLDNSSIRSLSTEIAYHTFESDKYGLEISLADIKKRFTNITHEKIERILNILEFAKIIRVSKIDKKISFVHRRFNEYFVVNKLVENPNLINTESIPTDSRWRDALVLFCEIGDPVFSVQIAEYCWGEIKKLNDDPTVIDINVYLRSIHCLRFLTDAFRSKQNLLSNFQDDLTKNILKNIEENKNILLTKFTVEATGLLNDFNMEEALLRALKSRNSWINEIAFKSSRYLGKINQRLEKRITNYIASYDMISFIKNKKELSFSLSLSDSFANIKQFLNQKALDLYLFTLGIPFFLIISPYFSVFIIFAFASYYYYLSQNPYQRRYTFINFNIIEFLIRLTIALSFFTSLIDLIFYDTNHFLISSLISGKSNIIGITDSVLLTILSYSACLLTMPLIDLINLVKKIKQEKIDKNELIRTIKLFLIISVITGAIAGIVFLIDYFFDGIFETKGVKLIGIALLILVGCLMSWIILVQGLYAIIKDYFTLKKFIYSIRQNDLIEREEIIIWMAKFKTDIVRFEFVKALDEYSLQAIDNWPGGSVPNRNDNASVLLAILEEKWLGLDR